MSADNWTVCPQCAAVDPFLDASDDDNQTLREDYQFSMTRDGRFSARYQARCTECGFGHEFTHDEQTLMTAAKERG